MRVQWYRIAPSTATASRTAVEIFSVKTKQKLNETISFKSKTKFLDFFYFYSEKPEIKYEQAIGCAFSILVMTAINTIIINQFFILGFHNGMKIRVAMCSLIYRKVSGQCSLDSCRKSLINILWHRFYQSRLRYSFINLWMSKALKLSQTALGETAAGKVVNLLSNDVVN